MFAQMRHHSFTELRHNSLFLDDITGIVNYVLSSTESSLHQKTLTAIMDWRFDCLLMYSIDAGLQHLFLADYIATHTSC